MFSWLPWRRKPADPVPSPVWVDDVAVCGYCSGQHPQMFCPRLDRVRFCYPDGTTRDVEEVWFDRQSSDALWDRVAFLPVDAEPDVDEVVE